MSESKIGVGIITCNRKDYLNKLLLSLKDVRIDELIVVNDGDSELSIKDVEVINNKTKLHVGGSKNVAMRYLLDKKCEFIFTLEDDILIKDKNIFEKYIDASKVTGIQHFNFGFSQRENLDFNLSPVFRKMVDYGNNVKIILTYNILGAFTFYTRKALQTIGLHHYKFNKGHGDHPELTYRAFKHGFTTPFWWFADLYESWNMIENQSDLAGDSLVRTQQDFWKNINEAGDIFKDLHGVRMTEVPDTPQEEVVQILKQLKDNAK